jgi:hypothetical protein
MKCWQSRQMLGLLLPLKKSNEILLSAGMA